MHSCSTKSKPEKPQIAEAHLSDVISSSISLVEDAALDKGVSLRKDLPDDLPPIAADQGKMEMVFRNIIANAVDATDSGGEVTIDAELDRKGAYVAVIIADNGVGMAKETISHIFDPFFTTKEGRGTGLGLSICHGIIEAHGGKVRVESVVGRGTVFTVLMPIYKSDNDE